METPKEIYLDNAATTRCLPEAAQLMSRILCTEYGNPSSVHHKGVEAEQHLRKARETFAGLLKVSKEEIFFTSGGTESDNTALIGAAMANRRRGEHLITTKIEHPAVLRTMEYLEKQGFTVTYLPVDSTGRIRLEDLEQALTPDTILVSVMHTNNEIGAVQPIAEAGALIHKLCPEALFHVDAVQGFGKYRIHPAKMNIDLLSASAHKVHGPKGVGLLYKKAGSKVWPVLYGGGQEEGLRSGTENVPGIAAFGLAASYLYDNLEEDQAKLRTLRKRFTDGAARMDGVSVNGPDGEDCAPHIVSLSAAGVRSEVLLHALEEKGIYVSAGSACSSHKPQPSATLQAIGLAPELVSSTLRFSFSVFTTEEEIDAAIAALNELIPKLRRYTRS